MPEYLFIYDHNILDGKEDSNYDPTDAILYFYPSSTSLDYQHSLCSHAMGFCQILSNLFQSSPKLLNLDSGAKIACIHQPNQGLVQKGDTHTITIALYSDDNASIHLYEKCTFIFESLVFYTKKCLACIFAKGKTKSHYINNIIIRLMNDINHREKLSSIFNTSLYCRHENKSCTIIDALVYQSVINIIDSIRRESEDLSVSVLGGCLFYQKCLILNQFSIEISNLFGLLIDCLENDSDKTVKEASNFIKWIQVDTENLETRNGVFVFQICVTSARYYEILDYSKTNSNAPTKSCCDNGGFHFLYLYLEHHSNMTILFVLDEPDLKTISKDLLKIFSNLCFNTLGDIEAYIATSTSVSDVRKDSRGSSNFHVWNINYDEHDRSLSATNSYNGTNIASDWEEWLLKRASVLHEHLEKEKSVNEIHVKVKKEGLSAERVGGHQIYNMKLSN